VRAHPVLDVPRASHPITALKSAAWLSQSVANEAIDDHNIPKVGHSIHVAVSGMVPCPKLPGEILAYVEEAHLVNLDESLMLS
jgi:hypothetical protein